MIFGTRLLIERVEALVHHRECPLLALSGHLYRTWLLSDAKRTRGVSVLTVIGWALMTRATRAIVADVMTSDFVWPAHFERGHFLLCGL